jgi:hypothetical protein
MAELVALFALPLVPIACGYHFAHYLPVFLVDVQHAIRAASTPARGLEPAGDARPAGRDLVSLDPARVYAARHAQVALIVGAHVAGSSSLMRSPCDWPGEALASQLPMVLLMIGYTAPGLWLPSTPTVGCVGRLPRGLP